ncbi:MAG: AAA family ATPase, partial [Clostridia bacterium]|nr:AAA family ATPase [Clostridia bacterium]
MSEIKKEIGVSAESDFIGTVSTCYFVDKSLLIKDLIDDFNLNKYRSKLFTRPRRFGKSLNLDMIKTFFEKTDEDTSVYFKDLKIWQCGEKYTSEQGKYPVIYLDFKEVELNSYDDVMGLIRDSLSVEFLRHNELMTSESVEQVHDLTMYKKISEMRASEYEMVRSLQLLSRMLYDHHKVKPIILIDEYDVPIQAGADNGYYDKILNFMKPFLSAGLKSNKCLSFAVLTGITRIFKEGTYSGLNNVDVYSVLNDNFVEYFGFTKNEVHEYLDYFGHADRE